MKISKAIRKIEKFLAVDPATTQTEWMTFKDMFDKVAEHLDPNKGVKRIRVDIANFKDDDDVLSEVLTTYIAGYNTYDFSVSDVDGFDYIEDFGYTRFFRLYLPSPSAMLSALPMGTPLTQVHVDDDSSFLNGLVADGGVVFILSDGSAYLVPFDSITKYSL